MLITFDKAGLNSVDNSLAGAIPRCRTTLREPEGYRCVDCTPISMLSCNFITRNGAIYRSDMESRQDEGRLGSIRGGETVGWGKARRQYLGHLPRHDMDVLHSLGSTELLPGFGQSKPPALT